jgi:ATP-dependent RNA helicase SUPV3L1/SUV3
MSEPEATQAGEPLSDVLAAPVFDASAIRGLQAPPVAETVEAGLDEAGRREALARELAARATRLSEAVDDALVLANDGAIRWLGDPVAKLAVGETMLAPRAVLLADEALPTESREAAERRVSLWLAEHMRKVLGPLMALADAEAIAEPAREIALKISQALGVLERERVKNQVKALDQEARGALRKLGVRFGAHYIFVPALLKPAARTLCAHLWALSRPDGDGEGEAEKLLHFAASGRTSFAVEPPASGELYRVAGFRLCGERAVRVDIVERLTDLIRAAMPRAPSSADEADGFIVTNQMTSLTGCSGEHFASILRSLGFVGHQVKKSAYLAAAALRAVASAPAPQAPAHAVAEAPEAAAPDAAPTSEPIADAVAPEVEATAEPAIEAIAEAPLAESPAMAEPANEAVAESAAETPAAETLAAETSAAETSSAGPLVDGEAASAAAAPAADADEAIEVWRPAPRRPRPPSHHHRGPPREAGAPVEAGQRAEGGAGRRSWRERKAAGEAAAAPAPASEAAKPEQSGDKRERSGETRRGGPQWRREGGGKGPGNGAAMRGRRDDRRDDRPSEAAKAGANKPGAESPRPSGGDQRKPSVNLDSPFAKLLDLKPLLQARDKSR